MGGAINNKKKRAAITGAVVIVMSVLLVIGLGELAAWRNASSGYRLHLRFNFLNNLQKQAPVKLAGGRDIGFVEKIYQKDMQTYVQVYIENDLKDRIPVKPETQFAIFTTSLVGQKYINLYLPPAEPGDTFFQDGDIAEGIDPPSLDQMLLAVSSWFGGSSTEDVISSIGSKTDDFIKSFNAMINENQKDVSALFVDNKASFTSIQQKMNILMARAKSLSNDMDEISRSNKNDIHTILNNINEIDSSLDKITNSVKTGEGTVGKFLEDKQIKKNVDLSVKYAKDFVRCMREQPWVLMYKKPCKF